MENNNQCNHDCSSCQLDCEHKNEIIKEQPHKLSKIKNVIGIVSGKGGVGKSLITSLLAVKSQSQGKNTAIIDADVLGPSIPKMFGVKGDIMGDENGSFPMFTKSGIQLISTNFLLPEETDPVIWRGPVLAGVVTQFWKDIIWDNVENMFIDMPPGTGDVPLTVFQSLPIKGIVVVTSPQELVSMIVEKAVKMADMMNIPILAIVENMSYFTCPNCKEKHYIFGNSNIEDIARKYGIDTIVKLPIDSEIPKLCDKGEIEKFDCEDLSTIIEKIATMPGFNEQ